MAVTAGMQDTIKAAGELGALPPSAQEIQRIANDPTASLAELAQAVTMDPLLTAKVLKFANSAHYGLSRQVSDLKQAVAVLGMRTVRDVSIGMAIASQAASVIGDEAIPFLEHAGATAVIGSMLEARGTQRAQDAFVAGLLHDIGILVLMAAHGQKYQTLLFKFPREDERLVFAERLAFGFCHGELGAECLDLWGLPGRVVHAVRHHHDSRPRDPAVALLVMADALAHEVQNGRPVDDLVEMALAMPANEALGMTEVRLRTRLAEVKSAVAAFRPVP